MRLLLKALTRMPLPLLYAGGWVVYVVAFHLVRWRREQVAQDLANALPEKTPAERAAILRQSYRNTVEMLMEAIWGFGADADALRRRVAFENPEVIESYAKAGYSTILLAAHYCNWEWLLLAGGARFGMPLCAVYQPQRMTSVDDFLREARARFDINLIARNDFIYELMAYAGPPRGYALIADQTPRRRERAYWTRFLHRDTAFIAGADKVAKFLDTPVVYPAVRRVRRGHYTVRMVVLAEPPYGDAEDGVIMEQFARCLEQSVRESPADWLWLQKRWKHSRPADV